MARPARTAREQTPRESQADVPVLLPLGRVWFVAGLITYGITLAVAYRISFAGPGAIAVTMLPLVLAIAMVTAFLAPLRRWSRSVQHRATVVTCACWAVLVFDDTNWFMLTFAIYAVCFSTGRRNGIALAAAVSVIWSVALLGVGDGGWALLGPLVAFGAGSAVSITLWGASEQNETLAGLVTELRDAQQELANAEREKGVLEERARFAGEIHDTLAQGFTSIVLLSRAAMRSEEWSDAMAAIERTAEENLQAARRLVAAIGPAELDQASLPDALERQVDTTLQSGIGAEFRVVGEPRSLTGTLKVTILRAAQEALLNVRTHANATEVHATLTYLDDLVVLDIRDNGVGFTPGATRDRGSLTGGQGLKALEHRAATLGGQLTIETPEGGGAALSLQLPAPRS